MKNKIEDFVKDKEAYSLDIPMQPIDKLHSKLEGLGFDYQDDYDSNGWQVDFWMSFTRKDDDKFNYILGGSLWYGGFSITKEEKEEE